MTDAAPPPGLVILRGNSGSGKTTVATRLQLHRDRRLAVISQDVVRRTILRVRDTPDNHSVGLIDTIARHCLTEGIDVIVEGILYSGTYGAMLDRLVLDHPGPAMALRWQLDFDETLRRHATKPQAREYGADVMREWWRDNDALPSTPEHIITADTSVDDVVRLVCEHMGW